jgi:hypothetical protein
MTQTATSTYPRWKAWALITILSIALAEVLIGSSPFGLLHPLKVVLLGVVYGAQVLALASFVFRRNPKPSMSALWSAGFILGLYESYLTKVLWNQPWDDVVNSGLFQPVTLVVLAGFWHAYMAFIFPLAIGEGLMVRQPHIVGLLPVWFRSPKRLTLILLVVLTAISTGAFTAVPLTLVLALPYTAAVLVAAVRWLSPKEPIEHLAEVLPTRKQSGVLLVLIGVVFTLMYQTQRTEILISPERHWVAWAFYAAGLLILLRTIDRRGLSQRAQFDVGRVRWWHAGGFLLVAGGAVLTPSTQVVGLLWVWGVGGLVAVVSALSAVADALPERQGMWLRCHVLRSQPAEPEYEPLGRD